MKKINLSFYLYVVTSVFLFISCSKKPKVVIKTANLKIKRITLADLTLEMNYTVKNPYHVSIDVNSINQSIKFNSIEVAQGSLTKQVKIPAKSTQNVSVTVKIPFKKSVKPMLELIKGNTIAYSISSVAKLHTLIGNEERTIVRDGNFKLPIRYGGGPFKVDNLRVENQKLKFDLYLKVPRPEKQVAPTTKTDYKITIGDAVITKGSFKVKEGKTPFQTIKIEVNWPLNKGVIWLAKFATSGLKYRVYLHYDIGNDTEFIIDKTEKLDITKLLKPF